MRPQIRADPDFSTALEGARISLLSQLGRSAESAKSVSSSLGRLRALREMEKLCRVAKDPSGLEAFLEEAKERDSVGSADFAHLEESLLQRYTCFSIFEALS